MVHILTGEINTGKTTRLLDLYKSMPKADGFISIKNMMNHTVIGYDILRLSDKERKPFIVRDTMIPKDFESLYTMGPYCFSKSTLNWVESSLKHMISHGCEAIFLDEIGPLELEGQCFDGIVGELVESGCELYITVRTKALEGVLERYNIRKYECLEG